MTTTPRDDELTARLRHLTDAVESPVPTAALVRRGRAKVRRRRAVQSAAAVSVVTAACALGAAGGLVRDQESTHDSASVFAGAPTSFTAHKGGRGSLSNDPTCGGRHRKPRDFGGASLTGELRAPLDAYRDLLIRHLDSRQEHLLPVTGMQIAGSSPCTLTGLGTKLGWKMPGQSGLGVVQVEVTTDWDSSQTHLAHAEWEPAAQPPRGSARSYIAEYPGGTAVAVTRADGTTVAIDAAAVFGNNTATPVTGMDLSASQLLEAAADPGFELPRP